MTRYPVDEVIPELISSLESCPVVILQAPPGSGKTTRVPPALLQSNLFQNTKIVMLEPRRLAAVNSARWISSEMGEPVGGMVGYAVRFERKVSEKTRLEVLTEGLLTRRMQKDPFLEGVGIVIFDEFHERSLQTDTALALCLDIQKSVRSDLKILIMSATIDPGPLLQAIPAARLISCRAALFPVRTVYAPAANRDIVFDTADAVCRAIRECEGDILVFLPGSGEIRRCHTLLKDRAELQGVMVTALYGDLPFAEQEAAIKPGSHRKVVLATNIAETSLTIEGITVVIDSGFCRRLRFDPAKSLNRLVTERISAASAAQRAGRAGRLAPGVCYRLWSEYEQKGLIPYNPPEIQIADLAELVLNLALWGVSEPDTLCWLDSPPIPAVFDARRTLMVLGALDDNFLITVIGRRMAELPLHPRLAKLLVTGIDLGMGEVAADLAALLSERDILRSDRTRNMYRPFDLGCRLDALAGRRAGKSIESESVDQSALRAVDRTSSQLRRIGEVGSSGSAHDSRAVGLLVAAAFPDRIAMQREAGSNRYLLSNGRGGMLDRSSALTPPLFLVAAAFDAGEGGEGRIFLGAEIAAGDLRTLFARDILKKRTVFWDAEAKKAVVREEEFLGALLLGSRPDRAAADDVRAAFLNHIENNGTLDMFSFSPEALQYQARVLLMRDLFPEQEWPDISTSALTGSASVWLPELFHLLDRPERGGVQDILPLLKGLVGWKLDRMLDEAAPTHIPAPSGSRVRLDYVAEGGPVMAVKLQELFGLSDTPAVAGGRRTVLIHLLSPAGRPMQVTRDLRSFWDKVYPEVKKELKGRYPRHPWPDDPWTANPTRFTTRRAKRN
jgi:ATP-dependent helicase HrpB